jgi:hypothetical protein
MADPTGGAGAAENGKLVAHLEKKVRELETDNKKYRDKLREKAAEMEAAKPAAGTVVLTADDAKRWDAMKKLEGEPKEIAAALERGKAAEAENAEFKQREHDRTTAEAMGWKASVWSDQRQLRNLSVELRDATVEEDGQKVTKKVPHVRKAGDEKAEWTPLEKYAETELADYLPSLKSDGGTTNGKTVEQKSAGWPKQTKEEGKAGGYDPRAAGKAMAEAGKKAAETQSLAFK